MVSDLAARLDDRPASLRLIIDMARRAAGRPPRMALCSRLSRRPGGCCHFIVDVVSLVPNGVLPNSNSLTICIRMRRLIAFGKPDAVELPTARARRLAEIAERKAKAKAKAAEKRKRKRRR